MNDRAWMTQGDPEKLVAAVDYALALLWKPHGPKPEPNAELAEMALSLVAGFYTARVGTLHADLLGVQQWCRENPGRLPETPSSRTN